MYSRVLALLISVTFLLPNNLWAKTSMQRKISRNLSKWMEVVDYARPEKSFKGGQIMGGRVFERYMKTSISTFSVGQLTFFKIKKNKDEKIDKNYYLNFHNKAFGIKFNFTRVGSAYKFEQFWKKGRRHIVSFLSEDKDHLYYSQSLYRPFYGKKIAMETQLLHRVLHKVDIKAKKSLNYFVEFLKNFPIKEAKAQANPCSACGGNPMCLMFCGGASSSGSGNGGFGGLGGFPDFSQYDIDQLANGLDETNTQLGNLNTNLGTMNNNWFDSNTNWQNSNENWHTSNDNWSNSNQLFQDESGNWRRVFQDESGAWRSMVQDESGAWRDMIQDESGAWRDLTEQESTAWRNMTQNESEQWRKMFEQQSDKALEVAQEESEQWRNMVDKNTNRALDLMERMSDPKNIFMNAAAGAAGAVLGASVMSLAINGVKSLVGFLWKWATGKLGDMKDAQVLEEFEKARKIYENSDKIVANLEDAIDQTLASFEKYKALTENGEIDTEDILRNISFQKTDYKSLLRVNQEGLDAANKNSCHADKVYFLEEIEKIERNLTTLESISAILSKADPLRTMCLDLKNAFVKLAQAEAILQRARPSILAAEEVWNDQNRLTVENLNKKFENLRKDKMIKKTKKAQLKVSEYLRELNLNDANREMSVATSRCRELFKDRKFKFLLKSKRKNLCKDDIFDKDFIDNPGGYLNKYFSTMSEAEADELAVKMKKNNITTAVESIHRRFYNDQHLFEYFNAYVDDHHDNIKSINDFISVEPESHH
jgi:hypothetical protein